MGPVVMKVKASSSVVLMVGGVEQGLPCSRRAGIEWP